MSVRTAGEYTLTSSRGAAPAVADSIKSLSPLATSSASPGSVHQPTRRTTQRPSDAPAASTVAVISNGNSTAGGVESSRPGRDTECTAFSRSPATASSLSHSAYGPPPETDLSHSTATHANTSDATTPVSTARRDTLAPGAGSLSNKTRDPLSHEQQRGIASVTATPPRTSSLCHHSDADIARVRAALAEAGYPDPSWADIERVFEQFALNQYQGAGSAVGENAVAPPAASEVHPPPRTVREGEGWDAQWAAHHDHHNNERPAMTASSPTLSPQQQHQSQDGYPAEPGSLLQHLEPTLRLQRYTHLRERELEELCLRPSVGAPSARGDPRRSNQPQPRRSFSRGAMFGDPQVMAMAAHRRRAANIVFDATSDPRFRFFPATPTPQGTGTLLTSGTPLHSTSPPPTRLASYRNYYRCARPHVGSTIGGQVSYLDPSGRTLPRTADPVKRGEQMRLLWAKDSFLSQRHRPREAWRTRQITMTYSQGVDDCQIHPG